MKAYDVVGYSYEADLHCEDCTYDRFGGDIYNEESPPEDSEGNEISPIFAQDVEDGDCCGDCGEELLQ